MNSSSQLLQFPDENEVSPGSYKWLWAMMVFVLFALLAYWLFVSQIYLPNSGETDAEKLAKANSEIASQRGQFGDTFGGVNALFSGLAFAGIIYSMRLQRLAIEQQNRSLKIQIQQMAESQRALEVQSRIATEANVLQALSAQLEYDRHTIEAGLLRKANPPEEAIKELIARQPALVQTVERLTDKIRCKLHLNKTT